MRTTVMGAAAVLALALAPASVLAQDEMSGDDMMMASTVPHPAHIHAGLCPAPGDVVAPLNDVTVAGNEAQGVEEHIHVDVSISSVGLTIDDILAADHSINVHQSADDMATYIACGNIGGHFVGDSFLVGLGAVGDSGYSGIAWLTDKGDGTTEVSVAISHSGATESMDTSDMDPGMDSDMGDSDMGDDDMDNDG